MDHNSDFVNDQKILETQSLQSPLDILKMSLTLKNLWPITQKHMKSTIWWSYREVDHGWLSVPPLPVSRLLNWRLQSPKVSTAPPIPNKVPTGASSYIDPSPMSCCPVLIFWFVQNLGARRIRNILDWDLSWIDGHKVQKRILCVLGIWELEKELFHWK